MLISHTHRFIFIHIFKTAGTSVNDLFLPYSRIQDRIAYWYRPTRYALTLLNRIFRWGHVPVTGFRKHATALQVKRKLPSEIFDNYFKFAFVRNPWDLRISLYFYVRENRGHQAHSIVKNMDFKEYIRWESEGNYMTQSEFILNDDGEIIVDYIGRYEQLSEGISEIQSRLQLPRKPLPQRNVSRTREFPDYRHYYDEETRDIVARCFKKDIELFNYEF